MNDGKLKPALVVCYTLWIYVSYIVYVLVPRSEKMHAYFGGSNFWGYAAYESEVSPSTPDRMIENKPLHLQN